MDDNNSEGPSTDNFWENNNPTSRIHDLKIEFLLGKNVILQSLSVLYFLSLSLSLSLSIYIYRRNYIIVIKI